VGQSSSVGKWLTSTLIFSICRVDTHTMYNPVRLSTRCGRPIGWERMFVVPKCKVPMIWLCLPGGGVWALVWSNPGKPPYFLDLSCEYNYNAEPCPVCLIWKTGSAGKELF
jgi:hypothetical protein